MRRGRGVAGQRFGVAQIDESLDQRERVVEFLAALESSLDPKGDERTGTAAKILSREPMKGVLRESGVVDPFHSRILPQIVRYASAVLHMALDPQGNRLDALQQQKRAERRQHG